MKLIDLLNPFKTAWWRKDEWYRVVRSQNVYKVVEKNNCPSWELEFWFFEKYKNKHTCEERWRKKRKGGGILNKTIFKPPEAYIAELNEGKEGKHYRLQKNIDIYDGPKYEDD